MKTRLILLCGLPGSGKTTLARQLAQEMPAVRFGADEWKADLGLDYFDEPMHERLEQRLLKLTWELLALGQDVILEFGFWAKVERDALRLGAQKANIHVELYFLDVPLTELERRLAVRNAAHAHGTVPITNELLRTYVGMFQAPLDAELSLFDTPTARPKQRIRADEAKCL